ncbi:S100P-binding protein isoform X1 [Erythrolamprus reginae]|uniref:S100P-binding protein isoform X1 n=1 Tax=Erythrolamprus reginae TaxID=121349 RepID=UPI00396C781C
MAAGSRSKRHLEEACEEDGARDAKRQCCVPSRCSSSQAPSLPNGREASPASSLSSSGCWDNDLDDAILARSDEEKPDSPTGLSREAEDELIAEDGETSPCSLAVGVNSCEDAKNGVLLACPESARPLRALDEVESTKPLPQAGSPASSSEGALSTNGLEQYLNKRSQIQAEFGANRSGLRIPEAASDATASLNPERGLSGKTDNEALQTVTSGLSVGSPLEAEHKALGAVVDQSSAERQSPPLSCSQLRGKNTSKKELDALDLHAVSTRVNGQRKDCVEVPDVKKSNSPVKRKRILIQEADLESRKARYINAVLNHASSVPSLIGTTANGATAKRSDSALTSGLSTAGATLPGSMASLTASSAVPS